LPIDRPGPLFQLRDGAPAHPRPIAGRRPQERVSENANTRGGILSTGDRPHPSKATRWAWLIVPIAATCWPAVSAPGLAGEPKGPGSLGIEHDLRAIRTRIDRAPRASSFDLDRVERDLWEHRLDAPKDPKVLHLEREIRDLRHDADRHLRGQTTSHGLRRLPDTTRTRVPIR
jgi:hypothetical protein